MSEQEREGFEAIRLQILAGVSHTEGVVDSASRMVIGRDKRIAELESKLTKLSGASGSCTECERMSRINRELVEALKLLQNVHYLQLTLEMECIIEQAITNAEG